MWLDLQCRYLLFILLHQVEKFTLSATSTCNASLYYCSIPKRFTHFILYVFPYSFHPDVPWLQLQHKSQLKQLCLFTCFTLLICLFTCGLQKHRLFRIIQQIPTRTKDFITSWMNSSIFENRLNKKYEKYVVLLLWNWT